MPHDSAHMQTQVQLNTHTSQHRITKWKNWDGKGRENVDMAEHKPSKGMGYRVNEQSERDSDDAQR